MGCGGIFGRIAEPIASTPNGLDIVFAAGCLRQLFAQFADENIDDLERRLVHPAIEMAEKHLLGYRGALPPAEQLEDAVFFAGQPHRLAVCLNNASLDIDDKVPNSDR